jgi:WD40 repeat protein
VSSEPLVPFKGLASFHDSDADVAFFFGRDREREVIEANLMASRLTIVYGEPGVGKTSVLRAGVAHHLRLTAAANLEATGEPGLAIVLFEGWRDDPVEGLRRAVAEAATRALGGSISPGDAGTSLSDAFGLWQNLVGGDLYVVLDQAEQYFLYHGDESGPETFAEQFPALVADPDLRVNFLLAIREDALAKLDAFRRRLPGVLDNYLRLEHLTLPAARAAIVEPVAAFNRLSGEAEPVSIEPALVDAVLEQVAAGKVDVGIAGRGAVAAVGVDGGHVETPYLQLVMRRLWDAEREDGSRTLRRETLTRLGGAEQIVREHVELALASLTPSEKDIAARLFDHLVTPSGTKIAHEAGDLAQYAASPVAEVLPVLTKLGDERIVRSLAANDAHGSRYEIFHDVLAEPVLAWKGRHEQTRALEHANALARRKHRRLTVIAAAAMVALVVLAGLTVFAFTQQSTAQSRERTARSRALAASALTQLGVDPELSLLLALDAARVQDSPSVEGALRTALLTSRVRRVAHLGPPVQAVNALQGDGVAAVTGEAIVRLDPLLRPVGRFATRGRFVGAGGGDAVFRTGQRLEVRSLEDGRLEHVLSLPSGSRPTVAVVDPSGRLLAFAEGRRVEIVSLGTGRTQLSLLQPSAATALVFNPSSSRLAVGAKDGTVRLWTLASGTGSGDLAGQVGAIRTVAFSPFGALVASGSGGTARVFRVQDESPVAIMAGHTNPVTQVSFSPDGTRLVTASLDGTARVWKLDTGAELATLAGHRGPVTAAVFVDDSDVATGGDDGTVRLWYVLAEPELKVLAQLRGPVTRAAFLSANRIEAVTPNGHAHVFDLGGHQVGVHAATPPPPVLSTLGARAVPDGTIVRIHEPDGTNVVLRGHTGPVSSARFSPDGSAVVTASSDGTARVWDVRTGASLETLRGHFGAVTDASFSPDGRWIVTAGPGTAALWSADAGERPLLLLLRGHVGPLTSASFDPTGTVILTSGVDGTVRTYVCAVCRSGSALLATAQARLAATGRTLSPAEQTASGA